MKTMQTGEEDKYLSVVNIVYTYALFIAVCFLLPSGGFYSQKHICDDVFSPSSNAWYYCGIEALLLIVMWSFSAIVKRNKKKTIILSIAACICYFTILLLQYYHVTDDVLILFINPVALSLVAGLVYDKKYKFIPIAYLAGVLLSFFPLLGSLPLITFIQLFLCEYPLKPQSRSQSFCSRLVAYFMIGIGIQLFFYTRTVENYVLLHYLGYVSVNVVVPVSVLVTLMAYLLLNKLLKSYYHTLSWKKVLSYIPVLWCIPLILLLFEKHTNR
ncbi:MAG: hypothetical protein LBQ68_03460 [Clostridiales bacterium]|jgi:hypothetical protein|nr:hypothetical protein [Clostridiales bacterium]